MVVKKISSNIDIEVIQNLIVTIIKGSSELTKKQTKSLINKTKNIKASATDTFESIMQKKAMFLPYQVYNRVLSERYRYESNYNEKVAALLREN